jgi:hypothetical protein
MLGFLGGETGFLLEIAIGAMPGLIVYKALIRLRRSAAHNQKIHQIKNSLRVCISTDLIRLNIVFLTEHETGVLWPRSRY